ncbi:Haloalkane dehalogenase [Roseivivax sp. THAF40]|uniref:alpha/beta fold hydrolase n=1 Tax=unclassified Roseivivax TaxID=2639302 RepID=UPI001268D4C8|nr:MULTISPECIES: alpha/beta hydrolase [unclassified Roseivivax]QFS84287.1 Haloalkane dehalogenase [Roseivivax sp. THAF197b]QFT48115.1 Haloalkane dehalogenase [Roseivivax sp. THAF40]
MPKDSQSVFPVHSRTLGASGGAPALALHCALAHGGAWKGVVNDLGDRLSVTAPDMPGHGKSDDWDRRCDYHDAVTDAAETFLEDDITLLGHSFGATVALRLAERHPERIRRMVLIEPVLFAAARETAPKAFTERREAARPMMEALARGDTETAARVFTGTWGVGKSWGQMGDQARALLQKQVRIIEETEQALTYDSAGLLKEGALERCTMPILFLRGAQTEPILGEIHAALLARLPDAREVVIPEAGHMAPITRPDAVAAEIAAFLDKT